MPKLDDDALHEGLAALPGWQREGDVIARTYRHASFRAAVAFVAYVAEVAEALGHHPDVDIRYDRVRLAVTTHDAGGLTEKDLELARRVDARE
ncbi:MAG TPA: 4a-hydroxytetrahydrobiopterin dehydratase [Thermoanaerobaculia bacterium]|nr:4a-hydroxytetrahydrobiopterin dehydratase [Thermoanaerobaculia bacterium]